MQELFLNRNFFESINLYSLSREVDDFTLIELCKTAVDYQVGSITVAESQVENVWKWLELSNVKLCGRVNNFSGKLSVEQTFNKIKSLFNQGADFVELVLPPVFFDVDIENIPVQMHEYLLAVVEAKGSKKIKVSFESSFIKYCDNLKYVVYLLSKYQVDYVKTSSGLYSSASSLEQLNAILEESKSSNIKVDFLFDRNNSNMYICDDAFRLADVVLRDDDVLDKRDFYVSCSVSDFLRGVGKSTC